MSSIIGIIFAMFFGQFCGSLIAIMVITGYAAVILTPIFNVYYAIIFLVVGGIYTH
jgi:hypothetical protein